MHLQHWNQGKKDARFSKVDIAEDLADTVNEEVAQTMQGRDDAEIAGTMVEGGEVKADGKDTYEDPEVCMVVAR